MRESICTIPITDGFIQKKGCPVCNMRYAVEKRAVEYIMGPAMMEPDIRISTNEKGFCYTHLSQLKKAKNRLSLALMLDSHLKQISDDIFKEGRFLKPGMKKTKFKLARLEEDCFICESIEQGMSAMLKTACLTYENDKQFRLLFSQQEYFCLPHLKLLIESAEKYMQKDKCEEFCKSAKEITSAYLKELNEDVRHFCDMFDYRNSGDDADWGNSKDSIERAIKFLRGRSVE
ncbi:MAG: DUF6062 family protein [Acutalibacteraceae bacterium]|nr:DUF6062 family protein [Acutalibacteraceae bacterium]